MILAQIELYSFISPEKVNSKLISYPDPLLPCLCTRCRCICRRLWHGVHAGRWSGSPEGESGRERLSIFSSFSHLTGSRRTRNTWSIFPTCRVRVSRFYQSCFSLLLLLILLLLLRQPPQLRAPDLSGHCRTSTASAAQWALPDLNRELQISEGTAGPQPDARGNVRENARKNVRMNAWKDAR